MKAKAFFGTHAGTATVHRTVSILRIALFSSLLFKSKKEVSKNDTSFFGAEGETRTLAPVTRPTPLAGAPRHQLEYFSIGNKTVTILLLQDLRNRKSCKVAERVGFEPTVCCHTTVFKTVPL